MIKLTTEVEKKKYSRFGKSSFSFDFQTISTSFVTEDFCFYSAFTVFVIYNILVFVEMF